MGAEHREGAHADLRVLIVDDLADNRMLLTLFLRRFGIEPDVAMNGDEAVRAAFAKDYDLMFLDIHMPVMCGLEAVRKIRASGFKNWIVALTASAMLEEQRQCLEAGFSEVITRPFKVADLERAIATAKARRQT